MVKIKMFSMYDHFPDRKPKENEAFINCYNDNFVKECKEAGKNIALLLEPRSMIGGAYDYCYEHKDYFKYIFTHDSKLLSLPNAREFNWADVWLQTDSVKDKGISLCTSFKNWCPLHNARLELANYYKDKSEVDVFFGDWNNPKIPEVKAKDYLEHYKFSIVIENDLDDFWYTEKLLNCFATKTIPIYLGATKIFQRFNDSGIITAKEPNDIKRIVEYLYREPNNITEAYERRLKAIEDNYKAIEPYKVKWKERFFNDNESLLEGML